MRQYSFEMLFAQGGTVVYGMRVFGSRSDESALELAKMLPACHTMITPDGDRHLIREIRDTAVVQR